MMKLIKKHAGGGWLKDKAGKDRIGYWNYSDSDDPNMQKKIEQGYKTGAWDEDAQNYLKGHQDLKEYLNNAYKTLSPKLQYFTSDKKAHDTYNGQWTKISKTSGTTGHFAEKMKAAGYEYDKATGTYRNAYNKAVLSIDDKGNLHRKDAKNEGIIHSKLSFDPHDNTVWYSFNSTNPTDYGYTEAKKKALDSKASKDWALIGAKLNLKGKFYDTMLSKGFKYDPKTGYYSKDGKQYCVYKGKVWTSGPRNLYSHTLSDDDLKQLLGINK